MAMENSCPLVRFERAPTNQNKLSILEQQLKQAHRSVRETDIALSTRDKNQIFSWMLRQWEYEENKIKREGLPYYKEGEIVNFKSKKLRVLNVLGSGVEGIVYLVQWKNKLYALKEFDYKDDMTVNLDNMKKTMKAFKKIDIYDTHGNLVLQEMQFGLSLKFLDNHPLYDLFKKENPLLVHKIETGLERKWQNNIWNSVLSLHGVLYLIDPH